MVNGPAIYVYIYYDYQDDDAHCHLAGHITN